MPKGLDEPCWERAKAIATRYFGHTPNNDMEWAYTMGIYKHMCMTLPRGAKKQLPKQRQQKLGMTPKKQLKKRKGSRKPKTEYEKISDMLQEEGISEEMAEYIIELRLEGQNERANELYLEHSKN